MGNLQQKNRFKNILYFRPVLVLLTILVLVFVWMIIGFAGKAMVAREKRAMVESRVRELEEDKAGFSSNIEKLKTEEGIEENIRMKFGLAKEGEQMVVVVEDQNETIEDEESEGGRISAFFLRWFGWLY